MAEETSIWGRIWDTVDNVVENGLPAYLDNEAAQSATDVAAAQYAEKAEPSGTVAPISGGTFGAYATPQNLMMLGGAIIAIVLIVKAVR